MVAGIPKSETIWVTSRTERGDIFYTTAKTNDRGMYFIYKLENGKAVKLGKSKSPTALAEKYIK